MKWCDFIEAYVRTSTPDKCGQRLLKMRNLTICMSVTVGLENIGERKDYLREGKHARLPVIRSHALTVTNVNGCQAT